MEGLLKEVAAAAEGGGSGGSRDGGDATSQLHPGIAERVNLLGSTPGGGGEQAPPTPPTPSPEQQQQMLEFLQNLQSMQQTDPAEFDKAVSSLMGIPAGAPGGGGADAQAKSDSLASMIGSIQSMRKGEGAEGDDETSGNINIGQKQPEQHGIYITPEPGFVVKTRKIEAEGAAANANALDDDDEDDSSKGMKVFMNICHHEQVGAPGLKKRLDANGEEVEGMNIPMSVGAGRYGEDKSGGKCLIYDMIVNKKVLEESREDKSGKYRDFVCQLSMQCLEQKFSVELDRRYKLPKLKYMYSGPDGKVDQQYIKDRTKSPQIEEVGENSETASKAAQNRLKQKALEEKAMQEARRLAEVELTHSFSWAVVGKGEEDRTIEGDGSSEGLPSLDALFTGKSNEYREPITTAPADEGYALCLQAEVGHAHGLQQSDVVLKMNPYRLSLKLPRYKPLAVSLPVSVDPSTVSCVLSRREGFTGLVDLRLVMPLDCSDWASVADPGSKPWLMEAALSTSETGDAATTDSATNTSNPYAYSKENDKEDPQEGGEGAADAEPKSTAPEDVYHLRAGPNKGGAASSGKDGKEERGILHAEEEDIELPEDKFHRADASSSYYISQREQGVKDKWDKADKEREERRKNPDPNVEYIDVDDFKPGGKMDKDKDKIHAAEKAAADATDGAGSEYGVSAGAVKRADSETMHKASGVVADKAGKALEGLSLSSSTWTELLD